KNHQKEHSAKSRESQCRNPSPDGDAPIYPNDPDPDPEWNPPEYNPTPPGGYKDQILLYLIAGYILGIFLVLIWYYWNPQRARSDLNGTWFFIILFFLLLLILSQRRPARCIAVLCFPTLAHYQSRALIIALAFLIAFWGPVMNIIRNIDIMANSLNCQQNQLIDALWSVNSMISDPLQLMEELFKRTVDEVHGMTTKLEKFFVKLENPIADIYATYGLCASWLTLQNEQFGKRMGAPYTRCLRAGNLSIFQYQTEIGDQTSESCNQELFSWFCEGLKGVNSFFYDNLLLPQMVIEDIFQRLQICFLKIRLMFLATISFNHSGKPYPRILLTDRDLLCRQDTTTNKLSYIYFWLYLMVLILLLTVIIRSIDFRFRYLMSEHFENVYITKEFEVYEKQQSQIMGVQLLPLNNCEDNKYVKVKYNNNNIFFTKCMLVVQIASLRLLPGERRSMYRSGAFLFITGIQLYCLCLVDYSLYSMLALLRQHGNVTEADQPSSYSKMVIKGGGQIGSFLRDLVHAFEPKVLQMNSYNCLPVPENPKYWLYFWILVLYVLAWIMVFWEPYGLRQRHRIMAYFHPEVSCRRVQYLHYSILKGRR
ncbi:hypothetical protein KR059_011566, partial [Drosophila kikkawai]